MDLETLMNAATDAGFIVDAFYPYIVISLKNRAVDTMEVAFALNIPQSQCSRSGKDVLIKV